MAGVDPSAVPAASHRVHANRRPFPIMEKLQIIVVRPEDGRRDVTPRGRPPVAQVAERVPLPYDHHRRGEQARYRYPIISVAAGWTTTMDAPVEACR